MAANYMSNIKIGVTWLKAKELLTTTGTDEGAKIYPDIPLADNIIHAAAKNRHRNFFNYFRNIFIGDKYRNSSLGKQLDPDKPGKGIYKNRRITFISISYGEIANIVTDCFIRN